MVFLLMAVKIKLTIASQCRGCRAAAAAAAAPRTNDARGVGNFRVSFPFISFLQSDRQNKNQMSSYEAQLMRGLPLGELRAELRRMKSHLFDPPAAVQLLRPYSRKMQRRSNGCSSNG